MKYFSIIAVALLLVVSPAMAQKKSLRKFYRQYRGDAVGVRIGVGRIPLKFASWIIPHSAKMDNGTEMKRIISKLQKVKVYTLAGISNSLIDAKAIHQLKQTLIEKDGFESLVEVRHEESNVYMMNKGKDDELGNVVILVQDEEDFVMVNLRTTLHMDDVNALIQGFVKN
ncbi:DUF4252 domain-containing protein [Chitinophaga pinensis]|uniref:DUF4252 domain-containing protein n=1 Tax=Chitinophaga pinensis TaxID=79329 RepID=A0A5C6LSR1_9BACT|nr:DUF4252 domain-containing protein [Chitinophaga pinensis]TWV99499.1 DUF4252 domain-containing protein [Chitinophaga pinensis]